MRVLVLGSEGVLGARVCSHLEDKGIIVVRWDIKLGGEDHDLRNKGAIDRVLQQDDIDYVIFLAFDVGGAKYDVYNKEFIDNNMRLMLYTFESLSKKDTPFLHTSSQMANMSEHPYGALKCISDHYVKHMNCVNVRLWNVYGDEEVGVKSHVIPDFVHQALSTKQINMCSDGTDERQFVYVDDFADAVHHIMLNHNTYKHQTIDLASFEWVSINTIADTIRDICKQSLGLDVQISRKTKGGNNQSHKNEPTKTLFHSQWKPQTSLEQGIQAIIRSKLTKH